MAEQMQYGSWYNPLSWRPLARAGNIYDRFSNVWGASRSAYSKRLEDEARRDAVFYGLEKKIEAQRVAREKKEKAALAKAWAQIPQKERDAYAFENLGQTFMSESPSAPKRRRR
jgi:hypothetical protein